MAVGKVGWQTIHRSPEFYPNTSWSQLRSSAELADSTVETPRFVGTTLSAALRNVCGKKFAC